LSLEQLKPGCLVDGKIKSILDSGLIFLFQSLFSATIDLTHVGMLVNQDDNLLESFADGQRMKARIIYVDIAHKRVGVSLNKDILALEPPVSALEVGAKLEMKVSRVDQEKGLFLVSSDGSGSIGYAHVCVFFI
jgi:rRNA biogenesis protein RRP5